MEALALFGSLTSVHCFTCLCVTTCPLVFILALQLACCNCWLVAYNCCVVAVICKTSVQYNKLSFCFCCSTSVKYLYIFFWLCSLLRLSAPLESIIREKLSGKQSVLFEWFWSQKIPVVVATFVKYFERDPRFRAATMYVFMISLMPINLFVTACVSSHCFKTTFFILGLATE